MPHAFWGPEWHSFYANFATLKHYSTSIHFETLAPFYFFVVVWRFFAHPPFVFCASFFYCLTSKASKRFFPFLEFLCNF
jgi:hypothetical protein